MMAGMAFLAAGLLVGSRGFAQDAYSAAPMQALR